jgi:uncharacterized protein YbjT (DUF2867 family)
MILLTGASGKVGSELLLRLRAEGVRFRAAFHSPEKAEKARASGLDATVLDYAFPETLAPALEGIEKLFLLSPPGSTGLESAAVEEAKKAGVRRIVKLSVWGADAGAFQIARDHRAVEKRIEMSGIPFTFLRPNGFMQTYLFYAATIKTQSVFFLPAGESRYNIIDVRDVAAVAAATLAEPGHEGMAYALSGPEALSNAAIAAKLSAALGRTIAYVQITDDEFRAALLDHGIPPGFVEDLVDLQHYYVSGAAAQETPWVERITGRKPGTFDRFVGEYAGAFL